MISWYTTAMEILILLMIIIVVIGLDPRIKIIEYEVKSEKIKNNEKMIVISDFHSGKPEKIIEAVNKLNPTLIIIAGDTFQQKRPIEVCEKLLSELSKIAPCYFISGNHEFEKKSISYSELNELLENNKIINCDDKKISLNENINIYGFKDYLSLQTSVEMSLVIQKQSIDEICKNMDSSKFNMVLIHRPHLFRKFDEYPVDLMISGHAHGGQWRIPYILNGFYAPQQGFFPKRAGGEYPLAHGVQIVSRGLINHWFLPRFFNRPEIVTINLIENQIQ